MQEQELPLETAACSDRKPEMGEKHHPAGGGNGNHDAVLADSRLAERCVAGEVAAWEEFYGQCHGPLLVSIEVMLAPYGADSNLVDDISARVWHALIENDGKLLAGYRPQRGARLITFLRTVAKTEVSRHFRGERRRLKQERIALGGKPPYYPDDDAQTAASLEEFLPTLTPREREFYHDRLQGRPDGDGEQAAGTRSPANARQLTHRIRNKLLRFLGREA